MYCSQCQCSTTPSKSLKLLSKSWRTFHSPATRPSTQTEHHSFSIPPWQESSSHAGWIATSVPGINGQADDSNLRCQCSFMTVASYQADYIIYTDGSASWGTKNGGAAAVVTRRSPLQSEVVTTIRTKGRTFTSSYEGEAAAMESALSGHPSTPTIPHSSYSSALIVSPCGKPSSHPIFEHSQFTVP